LKVWIDLANSPHPLIFEPIARLLAESGALTAITVRDHAQTAELALDRWPNAEILGSPSPGGLAAKARTLGTRVRELHAWARRERPDVALSHNSYAQLAAARSLRIPAVTAMDYEHQPANHLAFRAASRVLVPEALPVRTLRRQGARPGKLIRYRGFKEQLYLDGFQPDGEALDLIGVSRGAGPLVVARAAPAGAAYHRAENSKFMEAIREACANGQATCVVLARTNEQRAAVRALNLVNVKLPGRAVDARSLVFFADLFIGAGGTMTREAALMGTPTVSLFEGRTAAVDRELERLGRLRRIADPRALDPVTLRDHRPAGPVSLGGRRLVELFAETVLTSGN
jgi:uncharacterized protein